MALSVGGYASAIAVAAFATRLGAVWTAVVGLATAGVVAGIGTVVAGPVYGVVTTHTWQVFLFAWMYDAVTIGLGIGLHPLLGRWTTPVLTMLFVMLNFTSSGGIFQPAFQPGFFAALNTFWSGAAWLQAAQDLQFLAVAFDDVLGLGHCAGSSQPNRPVMYSCVRFCLGAVKICSAGATSTISPR